jgi:hypothetical protein
MSLYYIVYVVLCVLINDISSSNINHACQEV